MIKGKKRKLHPLFSETYRKEFYQLTGEVFNYGLEFNERGGYDGGESFYYEAESFDKLTDLIIGTLEIYTLGKNHEADFRTTKQFYLYFFPNATKLEETLRRYCQDTIDAI